MSDYEETGDDMIDRARRRKIVSQGYTFKSEGAVPGFAPIPNAPVKPDLYKEFLKDLKSDTVVVLGDTIDVLKSEDVDKRNRLILKILRGK